ncbi:MAG: CHASE2 domain-containing protein, partial [Candidatus Gastranaerophilales bacterium]|nr:CHASE2 domain-containing protein [Candidatus Gastranaerophilales bacterium]
RQRQICITDSIIVVIIDSASTQQPNYKWPWTKDKYAEILDYFASYASPKIVGMDMNVVTFDEKNPNDIKFLNKVSKMDNLVFGFVPEVVNDDSDIALLEYFKNTQALDVKSNLGYDINSYYNGIINSSEKLCKSTKNYGSVVINPSDGGTVYSSMNVVKIAGEYYPSLALKMYLLANNTNQIEFYPEYMYIPATGLKIPYRVNSSNGLIRTDIRFYLNIPNSDYSHSSYSAYSILETYAALKSGVTPEKNPDLFDFSKGGRYLNPEIFKDKVVLIGANISGPSADVHITPLVKRHPGTDIQATVYDNLQNSYFLNHSGIGTMFFAFIVLSLLAFICIIRNKFLSGLLTIFLIDIVYMIIVCSAAYNGHMMTYSVPLVAQFVTIVFGYSFKFITENRNKEKIKQAMGKYLSQDIMKNVVNNIDDLKLGGKRAVVTVLFSDIRGFTSLSEKMTAEEVSVILNEYFAEMEPIITKYNGVINKFIGDAVMAIFGEPIQDINHPQNAVKCAYEMLKKVEYLRDKWIYEGKPKIEIGVGINTGEVFIGNIGTESRMEYTVIGDTVNLASRIESYNKVYKTNLLVSSSTYEYITDIADVIKINEVQIRGKAKKMNIYEVLRIDRNN